MSGPGTGVLPVPGDRRDRDVADKRMTKKGNGNGGEPMTVKQFAIAMSAIGGVLTGINFMIASSVLPQSENTTRKIVGDEINKHQQSGVHPSAISREELKLLVLDRLDDLATKDQMIQINARLDRMDIRLRELEKK